MSCLIEFANLKHQNTMGLSSTARFLAVVTTENALRQTLTSVTARRLPIVVLGDASNVLLPPILDALVILPKLKGIKQLPNQHPTEVIIEAMAGENWHHFVQYSLAQGWYGLENLSLIPGTVGASPIQNIGAYGVDISDRLLSLEAMNIHTGQLHTFSHAQCQFGYRDSVFKQQAGEWIVTRVRFKLSRVPQLVLGYGDVLAQAGTHPTPQSVATAICTIRSLKLPNPKIIANTGSFFKNPLVTAEHYAQLKKAYPTMPAYPQGQSTGSPYKLAAGWLIDTAGWRGQVLGTVSMYHKQALVMVNLHQGTLHDILGLQAAVQTAVLAQFGVRLEREPILLSEVGAVLEA